MKYFSENEVISILINTCKELCKDKIYKPETYMTFREKIDERPSIELPDKHGRLIDADQLQEVLNLTLSLVITDQLTDKEIELVHRTIGAISDAINDMDTILGASKERKK